LGKKPVVLDLDDKPVPGYNKKLAPKGPLRHVTDKEPGAFYTLFPLGNAIKGFIYEHNILNFIISLILRHHVIFTNSQPELEHGTVKFDFYADKHIPWPDPNDPLVVDDILTLTVSFDLQIMYYPHKYKVRPHEYLCALGCLSRRSEKRPAARAITIFVNARNDDAKFFIQVTGELRDGTYVKEADGLTIDFDDFGYRMIVEVNLNLLDKIPNTAYGYKLAGYFFTYGHISEVFERFCKNLRSKTADAFLHDAMDALMAKMKQLSNDNVALKAAQKDADENGYLVISEEGQNMPAVATYFDHIIKNATNAKEKEREAKEKERAAKEKAREAEEKERAAKEKAYLTIQDKNTGIIKKSIKTFVGVHSQTKNFDLAIDLSDMPKDIAEKLKEKTADELDEAYGIYLGALFDKAVSAFKDGKMISEVKAETGLSLLVLREIEKAPDKPITEEAFKKLAKFAWYPDDIED
jgi:hypothetical protein